MAPEKRVAGEQAGLHDPDLIQPKLVNPDDVS
jgi:hypothetical protein